MVINALEKSPIHIYEFSKQNTDLALGNNIQYVKEIIAQYLFFNGTKNIVLHFLLKDKKKKQQTYSCLKIFYQNESEQSVV